MTDEMLAEYEAGLEWVKQEQQFTTDTELWVDVFRPSALWAEVAVGSGKIVCRDFKDERLIEAAVNAKMSHDHCPRMGFDGGGKTIRH